MHLPKSLQSSPARFIWLSVRSNGTFWQSLLENPALAQKVAKAALTPARSWLNCWARVKAVTSSRQSEQTLQGVFTQALYFSHVSVPVAGSQMHVAPASLVRSHW